MTTPLCYLLTRRGVNLSLARAGAMRFTRPASNPFDSTFREAMSLDEIEAEARLLGHLQGPQNVRGHRWGTSGDALVWRERHRKALQARASRKRRAKAPPKGIKKEPAQSAIVKFLANGPATPSQIGNGIFRGVDSTRNHLKVLERQRVVDILERGTLGPGGKETLWKLR